MRVFPFSENGPVSMAYSTKTAAGSGFTEAQPPPPHP